MAQYYTPPRTHAVASTSSQPPQHHTLSLDANEPSLRSIYVFPNPSSTPPSPSTSAFSAPTDVSLSKFSGSGSEGIIRGRSVSTSRSGDGWEDIGGSRSSEPHMSTRRFVRHFRVNSDGEPELEIWDWMADSDDSVGYDSADLLINDPRERTSRWDLPLHNPFEPRSRSAISGSSSLERYFKAQHTRRANLLSLSSHSKSTRHAFVTSPMHHDMDTPRPRPRMHIPFLSFFASWLSIDDSTIHLITHPSTSYSYSALFPGNNTLSPPTSPSNSDSDYYSELGDIEPHGLAKLLAPPSEYKSLRDGLSVACDASLASANPFRVPALGFVRIFAFVSGALAGSGKVWREVWRGTVGEERVSEQECSAT